MIEHQVFPFEVRIWYFFLCKLVEYGASFFFPLSFTRTYFILTIVPVGHAKIANFLFGLTVQSCLSLGPPSVNRPAESDASNEAS